MTAMIKLYNPVKLLSSTPPLIIIWYTCVMLSLAILAPIVIAILAAIFDPEGHRLSTFFAILFISYGLVFIITLITIFLF